MNFQGYSNDKPSSRVLNPPGGRSNNIFGSDEPAKPTIQKQTTSTIVFGDDSPAPGQNFNKPKQTEERRPIPANAQHSRTGFYLFNTFFCVQSTKFRFTISSNIILLKGYNTITGVAYEQPEPVKVDPTPEPVKESPVIGDVPEHVKASQDARHNLHTSSRVLKPPGGGGQTRLW